MIGFKRALWGLAIAGFVLGLAVAAAFAASDHLDTKSFDLPVGLLIGWSFIGTGLYAWWRRPDNRFGPLMAAAGFGWFGAGFIASDNSVFFAIGLLLANLYVAITVHMLLAYPTGRLESRPARAITYAAYFLTTVFWVPWVLFLDFANESGCENCPDNPLQVADAPGVFRALDVTLSVAGIAIIATLIALLFLRWRRATGPNRAAQAPVLWAGIATVATLAVLLAADVASTSWEGLPEAVHLASLLAFASVPWAFLGGLLRSRMSRASAVSDLVTRLGESQPRRGLGEAIADALGDPSLQLVYWLPDSQRYVDHDGCPVDIPDDPRRTCTEVELGGERIGAIVHDASLADERELVRATGAAAALAIANERLDAQLKARLEELRTSRARLVQAGDAERRRLERNLHDGAQQRLVALALSLRMARNKLPESPETAAPLLESAAHELELALNDLRELARGIHPAILSDRGLEAALTSLADRSPVPVELLRRPDDRLPPAVEAAAYFVVSESLANMAKHAGAGKATVSVERQDGRVVIEVADDGVGGADPTGGSGLRGLTDRVAALDGRLVLESPPGAGTRVRAEIPCA
ncbi:MAG: histidine kinase [Thermoleophilaceae bacterium]